MNCTGSPAAATCDHTCCSCGISATQGPHHWPHTFRTRTLPLASATVHVTPWSVETALDPVDRERYDAPRCDVDCRRCQRQGPGPECVGPVVWSLRRRDATTAAGVVT